tara:strand:- start:8442 stop:9146 length:705 start_codon:yes stop_codon:yes gene_type:complete
MILTGHQPTYLPWLGLFHKISNADKYVYFDDVQYLPKEWMNRNRIKGVNNNVIYLTVPVKKKHFLIKKTTDLLIDNSLPWRRKHLKSLEVNYKKAIFFEKYIDEFAAIYRNEWEFLKDLNLHVLKVLLKLLNIKIEIIKLSELQIEEKKSNLVLSVCKKLEAHQFIFGEKGRDYAIIEDFEKNMIKPVFQSYNHPTYQQIGDKFISHLSVIDLLFNCGDKSMDIINKNQISIRN